MMKPGGILIAALLAVLPVEARADVAPADSCTSAGQSCTNAPPDYKTSGTCRTTTCHRSVPAPDGGRQTIAYDCTLCIPDGAGGGGNGGASGETGGASGAAGATESSGDSGCAVVTPGRAGGTLAALFVAAGALALLSERRRRRP